MSMIFDPPIPSMGLSRCWRYGQLVGMHQVHNCPVWPQPYPWYPVYPSYPRYPNVVTTITTTVPKAPEKKASAQKTEALRAEDV